MPSRSLWVVAVPLVLALIVLGDDDCYKYGKSEFTTITECEKGCEYVYIMKGPHEKRVSGGCASDGKEGCRTMSKGFTICVCKGDYCNVKGYEMSESVESNEH
ncbi:unnamed protein product [Nippostrongylus brasiliensis]|uniref:Toxin n=1 Tax=Nippostrongylus brasiliensis TaxID=27835 RepID=A0A0N4XU23_NIPBR|nr:hypothetical protein Q1695_011379 [Nippostrongylus brasiliensis]VDL69755.1 unnamed protein product [Nippostrongylus brasiliensis]